MKIASRKRYLLNNTHGRFVHLATVVHNVREFMYFLDSALNQTYIEEITGGHLSKIEDDSLWYELGAFLQEQKVTNIKESRDEA